MKYRIAENVRGQIAETIDRINEKLDNLTDQMAWLVRAEQRFGVGQRVEWSRKALKMGWPTRKKAKRGTVKKMDGLSVVVKLDGMKEARPFHHAFFNPVTGPKLF